MKYNLRGKDLSKTVVLLELKIIFLPFAEMQHYFFSSYFALFERSIGIYFIPFDQNCHQAY